MHSDVIHLLAVQQDDLALLALEKRLAALAPRLAALERERDQVAQQLERVRSAVAAEETRHREALQRVESTRALGERSQRQFESVTSPREAAAAHAQLEQTRRMMAEADAGAQQIVAQLGELRHQAAAYEQALREVESRQVDARAALEGERAEIEALLAAARRQRDDSARAVPRPLLALYDRVQRRRRGETVFPLRGVSCGACDTAVPTQRRAQMAITGALEMCEGCGVLLYAGE